ncbi:TonB-dependent receptor plug domain-containing protein [Thalassotalea mangrovi]|uniref:TonB-dependent receptor plug domain-containing protein n=1 Tax=Thalassotalea mangrovi TaxID=2572245 RepID=UPI001FE6F648|nr:TonB-dependent receptor plug domain-containing protein [Thalassotalea mangrovi]
MKSTTKTVFNRSLLNQSVRNALYFSGLVLAMPALAQDAQTTEKTEEVETITVVGSQIRGGAISEALAVSVVNAEDIETMGVDSGDELMSLIPENGQNFFNEAENISGGVNAARGDVGAFNLRNLGTGNTLVLLNGRRLVNSATFQTEEVGGSFVPVNSVNSNTIPVVGLQRVEVLRDGASAIYGADAVAGVVNHVLKSNYEGFTFRGKLSEYDNFSRGSRSFSIEAGKDFNDGATNVSVFYSFYDRDRVSSLDDERWASSDFRDRLPEDSPWAGSTDFRNDTANSLYGKFDIVPGNEGDLDNNGLVDSGGEFHVYPISDPACADGYQLSAYTCGISDDDAGFYRLDYNAVGRDIRSDLQRNNVFVFVNHEFDNDMESFSELSFYKSQTNMVRHASASFSTSELVVSANNYYNPFGGL